VPSPCTGFGRVKKVHLAVRFVWVKRSVGFVHGQAFSWTRPSAFSGGLGTMGTKSRQ
jgi:hypothetical protein